MSKESDIYKLWKTVNESFGAYVKEGQGRKIKVQIGEEIIETEVIPQPVHASSYRGRPKTEAKKVTPQQVYDAMTGQDELISVEVKDNEILVTPKKHLGEDWKPINDAIRKMTNLYCWNRDRKCWVIPKA